MPRPEPKLTINLAEGSVAIKFSREAALQLEVHIHKLMDSLRLVATKVTNKAESQMELKTKLNPQAPMEYQHAGDVFLEVFCNPNIWPSPFAAKVLITLRDDRIRLTTEAELSRLIEDVNQYLEAVS